MKKKYFINVFLILSIIVFFSSTAYAAITVKVLNASYVKQMKLKWCWVATAENAIKWEGPTDRDQWDAVNRYKGSFLNPFPNEPGTLLDTKRAAEYISKGQESYIVDNSKKSYKFLRNEIDISNCIALSAGYYRGFERVGGHMVLMYGYNVENGLQIKYYDPSDGTRHTCYYDSFESGSYNGRKYDGTVYNNEAK
jgi:hypothetical protein